MKDPTPETPLTADDLGKAIDDGMSGPDGYLTKNAERREAIEKEKALAAANDPKERPWWKQPRRLLGILTMLFGVGMSIAAGSGADPEALETARAVGEAATGAAEQLVAAEEAGDWTQGAGGAAAIAIGAVAAFGKKKKKKN